MKKILTLLVVLLSICAVSAAVEKDTASATAVSKGDGKSTDSEKSTCTSTSTEAVANDEGEASAEATCVVVVDGSSSSIKTKGVAKSDTKVIVNPAVTVEISHSMANSHTIAKAGDDGYCAGGSSVSADSASGNTGTEAEATTYAEASGQYGNCVSNDHDHEVDHNVNVTHH